jgi:two-component system cell cycle sensor histidine kinase/response regulator CckA
MPDHRRKTATNCRPLQVALQIANQTTAPEELKASEEPYRSVVDKAPFGIYRRSENGALIMVNPALVQMLGYETADEVLALDFFRDVYCDAQNFDELLTSGRDEIEIPRSGVDTRFRRKDGMVIVVRLNEARITSPNNGVVCAEGFVENVTAHREVERQLQLAQKMDAIGQMAAGVAHDFNNVLNIIGVYAELLAMKNMPSGKTRQYAEGILEATNRGAVLTQQLLTFGRGQALEPSTITMKELLHDFRKTLPRLLGRQIDLKIVEGSRRGAVRIDRGRWEQVILNLVINARDSMPYGGVLTIETSTVEIPPRSLSNLPLPPSRYIQLTVSDTGAGMDENTLLRIFEPFFTTKERGQGTGLGLTLVYGIVNQSGGFVSVSSSVGVGTVVRILLPHVAAASPALKKTPQSNASFGTESILFVEDEDRLRIATSGYLRQEGYEVVDAADGKRALKLAAKHPKKIDLLITDVGLQGMSVHEMTEELSKANPDVNIIFVSGSSFSQEMLGPKRKCVQKPYRMKDLAVTVRTMLAQSHDSSATAD